MGIKRQFVYWVNLDPTIGTEINKTRPCLVLSSDLFNNNTGLITVVPITDIDGKIHSTQVPVYKKDGCVPKDSKVKVDQLRTIDSTRIRNEIGKFPDDKYQQVKDILRKHLNL